MKDLVTGGSGFVGASILRAAEESSLERVVYTSTVAAVGPRDIKPTPTGQIIASKAVRELGLDQTPIDKALRDAV